MVHRRRMRGDWIDNIVTRRPTKLSTCHFAPCHVGWHVSHHDAILICYSPISNIHWLTPTQHPPRFVMWPPLGKQHKKQHHKCSHVKCGKTCAYACLLAIHMVTLSVKKPHVCETCDKAFSRPIDLTMHMRTHSGEKPYVCETCDKAFAQAIHLARHMSNSTPL